MWRGLGILKEEWQLTPQAVQIVLACLHHQFHALKIRCSAYEQQLAMLWRRKSFGTQSARDSEFVERILTAVQTLRQQERDVLEYLSAVCCSVFSDEASQGLIPDSS
jgi:hypothetical protein